VTRKFLMMAAWGFKHINQIKLYQAIEPIKAQLGLINMALAESGRVGL